MPNCKLWQNCFFCILLICWIRNDFKSCRIKWCHIWKVSSSTYWKCLLKGIKQIYNSEPIKSFLRLIGEFFLSFVHLKSNDFFSPETYFFGQKLTEHVTHFMQLHYIMYYIIHINQFSSTWKVALILKFWKENLFIIWTEVFS